MDENRELSDQEIANVNGGNAPGFVRLVEEFARANNCSGCCRKDVRRNHEMCMEVFDRLLLAHTWGEPVEMKCPRRC